MQASYNRPLLKLYGLGLRLYEAVIAYRMDGRSYPAKDKFVIKTVVITGYSA